MTRTALLLSFLTLGATSIVSAANFQGVVVDRGCAVDMVKHGRAKTLKDRNECSLNKGKYVRSAYALITDDQKLYYFDHLGDQKALTLLKNTHDPDALRVIITGDLQGQTIKVQDMSML